MKVPRIVQRWIIMVIIPFASSSSSSKYGQYHNNIVESNVLLSILMIQGGSNNYHYHNNRRQSLYPKTTTKTYKSRYNSRDTQRYTRPRYDRSYDDDYGDYYSTETSYDDSLSLLSTSCSDYNDSFFPSSRKNEEQIISALIDDTSSKYPSEDSSTSENTSHSRKKKKSKSYNHPNQTTRSKKKRQTNHHESPSKEEKKGIRQNNSSSTTNSKNNVKVVYSPTTMQHPNTMLYNHHHQNPTTTTTRLHESKIDSNNNNNNINQNIAPFMPYPERNNPNYYSSYGRSSNPLYPNGTHNYPNNNRIQSPGLQPPPPSQQQQPTNPHLSSQGSLKASSQATGTNNLKSTSTGFVPNNHHRGHATTTTTNTATTTLQKRKQRQIMPSQQQQQQPTTMSLTTPWARSFILSRPKDALLPIPREFLSDGFNLVRLAPIVERFASLFAASRSQINGKSNNNDYYQTTNNNNNNNSTTITFPLFRAGLNLILEEKQQDEEGGNTAKFTKKKVPSKKVPAEIQFAAEIIYTLVHARYISSPRGLDTVRRMFQQQQINKEIVPIFGRCPRMQCKGMPLLPCGLTDEYHHNLEGTSREDTLKSIQYKAKRFCPSCGEAFHMWESKVDGSAWGKSFCHLFLLTHGHELFPQLLREKQGLISSSDNNANANSIEPRIFGYKIHPLADIRYPLKDS